MIKPKICRPRAYRSIGRLRPWCMSLIWISKPVVSSTEEEATRLSAFYFCICTFSVTVTIISTPLCAICHHFCCPMSLFLRPCCLSELNLTEPHYRHLFLVRTMVLYVTKFEDIPGRVLCYPFLNFGNTFSYYYYVTQFLFVAYNRLTF